MQIIGLELKGFTLTFRLAFLCTRLRGIILSFSSYNVYLFRIN